MSKAESSEHMRRTRMSERRPQKGISDVAVRRLAEA
jgi:hypothetical protein